MIKGEKYTQEEINEIISEKIKRNRKTMDILHDLRIQLEKENELLEDYVAITFDKIESGEDLSGAELIAFKERTFKNENGVYNEILLTKDSDFERIYIQDKNILSYINDFNIKITREVGNFYTVKIEEKISGKITVEKGVKITDIKDIEYFELLISKVSKLQAYRKVNHGYYRT